VTLFANTDQARTTARELMAAGVQVAAIIDPRPDAFSVEDCPVHVGAEVVGSRGRLGLTSITVAQGGETFEIETDCLAMSGGWNPTIHLTCHMNGRPRWDEGACRFRADGRCGAGAGGGRCGAGGRCRPHGALADGSGGAVRMVEALGRRAPDIAMPVAEDRPYRGRGAVAGRGEGAQMARLRRTMSRPRT
jgi:methylglutamate dehydrogenase subunit C